MTLAPALLTVAALTAQPAPTADACQEIQPTAAQRQLHFSNAVALGPFAMVTRSGDSSCDIRNGRGQCTLRDPGLIHITVDGRHSWFQIPAGRNVRIDIADRAATCHVVGG